MLYNERQSLNLHIDLCLCGLYNKGPSNFIPGLTQDAQALLHKNCGDLATVCIGLLHLGWVQAFVVGNFQDYLGTRVLMLDVF